MVCPNCGTEQPESFECRRCGIVFARWEEHQARQREGRPSARSSWTRPLGLSAKVGRLAVGFACLGIAILMFLSGRALNASGPFVAFAFFALAGAYFILTIRGRIAAWRFGVEALVLAAVSATFVFMLPDVFSPARPIYQSTANVHPASPTDAFLEAARTRIAQVRRFLGTKEFRDTEEAVALSQEVENDPIEPAFLSMPRNQQDLVYPLYLRLQALRPVLRTLNHRLPQELPAGPARWVPAAVSEEMERSLQAAEQEMAALERGLSNSPRAEAP